jgi:hypothetical protein
MCKCGCNTCDTPKAPLLNESLIKRQALSEGLNYHVSKAIPLTENVYRAGSEKYFQLWKEARNLYVRDLLEVQGDDLDIILETDLGYTGIYEGKEVYLDFIFEEDLDLNEGTFESNEIAIYDDPNGDAGETKIYKRGTGYYGVNDSFDFEAKDKADLEAKLKRWGYKLQAGSLNEAEKKKNPPLGKPKRGGSKKFYVYVRDPRTKKIKKVSFGDTSGLSAKINNPEARRAFAARHDCKNKKDKTKASFWSCRLPRYARLLGLKSSFSGFW